MKIHVNCISKTTITILIYYLLSLTPTLAQNKDVDKDIAMYTQLWNDIVNKGEIDLINGTHFDTNVVMVMNPKNIVGIQGFKDYYQNYLTGFSDIIFTVKNVFGQGDQIAKHWSFKGSHTGNFFGIPPTGNKVDVEGVTLVKMKFGKIVQEQDFMDNLLFMEQLGLISNPENVEIIDSIYKAFAKRDMPTVLGAMDAKIIWNEAEGNSLADGNPYIGPDAILNGVFIRINEMDEFFVLKDIELHNMSNNQVLATLRYHLKVKSTGKEADVQVAHLWTLNNGKIIAFQQYADTKKLAESEEN
ncbi:MAG: ester cyclase [Gelidibacter sp.]|uniref:ester cyclase n=1 Tax=Gelidibacter sp. TaxID=2018083 RepID=UPI0032655C45